MFLLTTLHFPGPIENVQENVTQVKNVTKETNVTAKKTDQNVTQIKDEVNKIKG